MLTVEQDPLGRGFLEDTLHIDSWAEWWRRRNLNLWTSGASCSVRGASTAGFKLGVGVLLPWSFHSWSFEAEESPLSMSRLSVSVPQPADNMCSNQCLCLRKIRSWWSCEKEKEKQTNKAIELRAVNLRSVRACQSYYFIRYSNMHLRQFHRSARKLDRRAVDNLQGFLASRNYLAYCLPFRWRIEVKTFQWASHHCLSPYDISHWSYPFHSNAVPTRYLKIYRGASCIVRRNLCFRPLMSKKSLRSTEWNIDPCSHSWLSTRGNLGFP